MNINPSAKVIRAARTIANELLQNCDYSDVYQDERLEDCTEDEMREVYDLITRGFRAVWV